MKEEKPSAEDTALIFWSFSKSVSLVIVSIGVFVYLLSAGDLI